MVAENNNDTTNDNVSQNPCQVAEKCVANCQAYGKVCPASARAAGHKAQEAIKHLCQDSVLFSEPPQFIEIDNDSVVVGKKLGEGGFSVVHDVTLLEGDNHQGKELMAVKFLKRKVMVQPRLFQLGAADLANECMFLAKLHHPHVISYHGIASGSMESNFASGKECGFFIIIDKLNGTLEERIEQWAEEANNQSGGLLYRMSHNYRAVRKAALQERLEVALQIADVMEYLHSLNIIYRDLKPENMGFDCHGNLLLFDFGLAKELRVNRANKLGKYKLTGNTGSRRYMAVEVAKNLPYDKSVDVYSFGILLWEMCAMEKPFYGYSANKHMQQVILGGERPKLDTSHTAWWPVKLHWVLRKCWSEDSSARPSFTVIQEILNELIHCKKGLLDDESNEAPASDKAISMSMPPHPERHDRAVTTPTVASSSPTITPPPEGFGSLKPTLVKSERAHTHSGMASGGSNKGHRKISLGGHWLRKHHS